MVSVEKINESQKSGHIEHHNALANAVNELAGEFEQMKKSVTEMSQDQEDMGATFAPILESIKMLDERLKAISGAVVEFEKKVSQQLSDDHVTIYYSTRKKHKVTVDGVKQFIVWQWQAPKPWTYEVDSFTHSLNYGDNLKSFVAPSKRFIEVKDMEKSVITLYASAEALETHSCNVDFDIEVFIHKIA